MNKKFKVIQINGVAGLIIAISAVLLILGSIIVMPVYGIKFIWNNYISTSFMIQTIKLSQASLLWFAFIAAGYGYLRSKICFKLVNTADFPDNTLSKADYEKFAEKIKKEQEENEKIHH